VPFSGRWFSRCGATSLRVPDPVAVALGLAEGAVDEALVEAVPAAVLDEAAGVA